MDIIAPGFAEALFGRRMGAAAEMWQDREVRFDCTNAELQPRKGETVLDYLDNVEDTKGNNGQGGELAVTNLRVTWASRRERRTNLSIGWDCVTEIAVRPAASRLRGNVSALYLLTRHGHQRFEFIFTALTPQGGGPELLAVVQGVSQAYEASRLYRELRLRTAVITDGELRLLPSEQAYSKVSGVANLNSDQGSLGAFFITNVRVVWFSAAAESFTISLPYLQMRAVRISDSKFGPALVVETCPRAGGYVLGFKVEPRETLDYVYKEISSLWQVYSQSPVLGVAYDPENVRRDAAAAERNAATNTATASVDEDVRIVEDGASARPDTWATACYAADADTGGVGPGSSSPGPREPVFSPELGLAIEAPRDAGTTVRQLWCVL